MNLLLGQSKQSKKNKKSIFNPQGSEYYSNFAKQLGRVYNSLGGISTDSFGRTNIQGVYAAGNASMIAPAQLTIAVAEGLSSR
ncbi:hypothetical protein BH23THE1_BH23THE1_25450 [soil metagenome]